MNIFLPRFRVIDGNEGGNIKDEDGDWGVLTGNGTFTGLIGDVQTGRADMAMSELTITLDRMAVVDFTYPHAMDSVTIVSPKPSEIEHPFDIVQPFSVLVSSSINVFDLTPLKSLSISIVLSLLGLDLGDCDSDPLKFCDFGERADNAGTLVASVPQGKC